MQSCELIGMNRHFVDFESVLIATRKHAIHRALTLLQNDTIPYHTIRDETIQVRNRMNESKTTKNSYEAQMGSDDHLFKTKNVY